MAGDYSQGIAPYLAQFPRPAAEAEALCAAVDAHAAGRRLRILDLGAGLGTSSLALAARGHQLLAVEPDPEMAAVIGARLAAAPELQPHLALLTDSRQLPGGDADLLICQLVLHLLQGEAAQIELLREAARLLRPGGQLWLELPVPSPQRQALPWVRLAERQLGDTRLELHREMHAEGELDWVTQWRFEIWLGERQLQCLERLYRWRPIAPELLRRLGEAAGLRWLALHGDWAQSPDGGKGPPGYGYARMANPVAP